VLSDLRHPLAVVRGRRDRRSKLAGGAVARRARAARQELRRKVLERALVDTRARCVTVRERRGRRLELCERGLQLRLRRTALRRSTRKLRDSVRAQEERVDGEWNERISKPSSCLVARRERESRARCPHARRGEREEQLVELGGRAHAVGRTLTPLP